MGWYSGNLKDMDKAIDKRDWNKFLEILDGHYHNFPEKGVEHDLEFLGTWLNKYFQDMRNINAVMSHYRDKDTVVVPEHAITDLKRFVKWSREAIEQFEDRIKHLNKMSRFAE